LSKKEITVEEALKEVGELPSTSKRDRFVSIEEIQTKIQEHQFGVAYYTILLEALENGDFVIYNSGPPATYRIVRKGQPDVFAMFQH